MQSFCFGIFRWGREKEREVERGRARRVFDPLSSRAQAAGHSNPNYYPPLYEPRPKLISAKKHWNDKNGRASARPSSRPLPAVATHHKPLPIQPPSRSTPLPQNPRSPPSTSSPPRSASTPPTSSTPDKQDRNECTKPGEEDPSPSPSSRPSRCERWRGSRVEG